MPKKTRKKSSKTAPVEAGRRSVGTATKSAAKKPAAKTAKKPIKAAPKRIAKSAKPAASKAPKKPIASKTTAPASTANTALIEGAKAPAFRLPRDGGQTVSLADYAGRKLVLFFYPRAGTPGCTKEAIDFSRLAASFAKAQAAVLGVSADPLKAQESFRNKYELTTPLISDEKHDMLQAYGAWGEKSMYGKTFQGVIRTTVLIGADGRILRIWRHVKVDGHADEVLVATQAA